MVTVHRLRGTTNTQEGINRARYDGFGRGNRGGIDDVMVVVTDGQSNVNAGQLLSKGGSWQYHNFIIILLAFTGAC